MCRQLRTFVPSSLKIFALTAQVLPEERELLLNSGFDGIIHKPFKEEDLIKVFGVKSEGTNAEEPDFTAIKKMTFGDREQLSSLLQRFLEDTKKDVHYFEQQIVADNVKEISVIVHRLAGRIAQFGGKNLGNALKQMELTLAKNETLAPELKNQLEKLKDQLNVFIQTVEKEQDNLKDKL